MTESTISLPEFFPVCGFPGAVWRGSNGNGAVAGGGDNDMVCWGRVMLIPCAGWGGSCSGQERAELSQRQGAWRRNICKSVPVGICGHIAFHCLVFMSKCRVEKSVPAQSTNHNCVTILHLFAEGSSFGFIECGPKAKLV